MMLIALGAGAAAKPSPYAPPPLRPAHSEDALYLGPAGAMLEADYFRAPPPQFGARRVFPCQFHLHVERASRLVQSCD